MHLSISRLLLGLLIFSTSNLAFAVNTKDCPSELTISVGSPKVEKNYAKALYEDYFRENGVITSVLPLSSKANGRCVYYNGAKGNRIFQAEIKGSLKANAVEAASLAVFGNLPISAPHLSFDLAGFVTFGKIATLSPHAVTFSKAGDLYRVGELCSYCECSIDYVFLGAFSEFRVEAKP